MKKLTALLLAGAMALSLAACGGGGSSSTPTPDASTPDASNTDTSTPSTSADTGAYDDLESVSLILADSAAPGAAGAVFDEMIAEKAAEITGGKLEIQTYINGELGADVDLLRQMQNGDIDMVGSQLAALVSFCPELAIFDLPWSSPPTPATRSRRSSTATARPALPWTWPLRTPTGTCWASCRTPPTV